MWKRHWLFYVILVVELQYQLYGTVYTTTIKIYEPTSHGQLYRNNNLTLKRKRTNLIVIYIRTEIDQTTWKFEDIFPVLLFSVVKIESCFILPEFNLGSGICVARSLLFCEKQGGGPCHERLCTYLHMLNIFLLNFFSFFFYNFMNFFYVLFWNKTKFTLFYMLYIIQRNHILLIWIKSNLEKCLKIPKG
jgi:hypothetical protein